MTYFYMRHRQYIELFEHAIFVFILTKLLSLKNRKKENKFGAWDSSRGHKLAKELHTTCVLLKQ